MKITLFNTAGILSAAVAVVLGGTYAYEVLTPTSNYFTFYGHIVQKDVFHSPDEIKSYTFGETPDDDSVLITFNNQLWCAPLDSGLRRQLVAIRRVSIDFSFGNPLDNMTLVEQDSDHTSPQYTQEEITMVRSLSEYGPWSMEELKPEFDSECHVSAMVTAKTPVFGIDKTVRSRSASFDYITGVEYSGTDFDGSAFDTGSLETLEELKIQSFGVRTNRLNANDLGYEQQTPSK